MEMHLVIQGKKDPPRLANIAAPIIDLTANERIIFCVVEAGMSSGEPSVIIVSSDDHGSVCLQTSLDKFMAAASGMAAAAEANWGWQRPEGHWTMLPPDEATRRMLLKALKQELDS